MAIIALCCKDGYSYSDILPESKPYFYIPIVELFDVNNVMREFQKYASNMLSLPGGETRRIG